MKSPMIQYASYIKESEKDLYSDLQVLESAAGYYIGTLFLNREIPGMEFYEPGSRDSEYFRTREEAQKALENLTWDQRLHP